MSAWFQKSGNDATSHAVRKNADADRLGPPGRRRVAIGLDFGTSTSKCCFREAVDRKPFTFVGFSGSDKGSFSPLFETAASDWGTTLLFGPEAARRSCFVHSFKMCLACQASREAGKTRDEECPRCDSSCPGTFRLAGQRISAKDLCTLHLAVILSEVLPRIPATIGAAASELRLQLHSAAPLDQLWHFGDLAPYFEEAVFYAFRLAETGRPSRRWPVADAIDALQQVRMEPLPAQSESVTALFPETHAAAIGLLLLPDTEKGIYGLIDVGAGTTDVSFFWLQKGEDGPKVWYYSTGTLNAGMDDVDLALGSLLGVQTDRLREARQAQGPDWLWRHRNRFDDVTLRIRRHLGKVYADARELHQYRSEWVEDGMAKYRLFLVGGGCACNPLVETCVKAPMHGQRWRDTPKQLRVPAKSSLVDPSGHIHTLQKAELQGVRHLLPLAYGLAHPRPEMPKFDRDREGLVVTQRESIRVSHEDLYT